MAWMNRGTGVVIGLLVGLAIGWLVHGTGTAPVWAHNDRHDDFVLCTGPAAIRPGAPTDGIWLLDYRTGKLLGTLIDRNSGKVVNWAEVDLVSEFAVSPRQNVHFIMTTGSVSYGQAALYLAETVSGKFAVYTMGPRPDNQPGLAIRRHDLTSFRKS
jgi:hypothetical protein